MFKLFLIALGGAAGTLARYGTAAVLRGVSERTGFPFGTLVINLLGCFLIGYLFALFTERIVLRVEYQQMILIGVLGGFTTFSSYAFESFWLLRDGHLAAASFNIVGQVVLGIAGLAIGFAIAR